MVAFQGKGEGNGGLSRQGGRPWWPSKARGKVRVAFQGKGKAMMAFQGKGEGHGSLPRQGERPWWYSKARGKTMVVFKGKGEDHGGLPR